MRFGLPDSSDDEAYSSAEQYSSDGYHTASSSHSRSVPRTTFGRTVREYLQDSSESELDLDSEDEVELIGGLDAGPLKEQEKEKRCRSPKPTRSIRSQPVAESSRAAWRRARSALTVKAEVIPHDEPSPYEGWLKSTEEQAMRDGHRLAHERRGELREIAMNTRTRLQKEQDLRAAREEEDMRRMLEAMAIKQNREEEELAKRFAEREKRLWKDVEEAIKTVERKEAELRAAQAAALKKKQEEEAARAAQAENEALARKLAAEKVAKENAEKQRLEKEAAALEEKRRLEEKERKFEEEQKARDKGRVGGEWRVWVDKQKWMKKEVIEPSKADRQMKMGLRQGMRLITRGLGQVVNTREGVLRVTNDIHKILCEQLPAEPSPSNPTRLSQPPPLPYSYLLSHLSKALVKQAESEVSAKSDAAFPLGRIVIGLLLRGHAAFGEVLFARFVKKCPLVVPFYPSRGQDQSREEFEKSTGRGSDESVTEFIGRMAGIFTLYLAIIQTPLSTLVHTVHIAPTPDQLTELIPPVLRMTAAWTWLAHALRDPLPALEPIAHLVTAWIEVLGAEAIRLWGPGQMGKIFAAIRRDGVEGKRVKGDGEASRLRLSLAVDGWQALRHPEGRDWEQ